MAMNVNSLASDMKDSVSGISQYDGTGITKLWNAICDYVESNGVVVCQWSGAAPVTPPTEIIPGVQAKILTAAGRVLDVSGIDNITTCGGVLSKLSLAMNTAVNSWMLMLPESMGFVTLAPGGLVPFSSTISLLPSMATDTGAAFRSLSANIIAGLGTASFLPASGTHLAYTGVGSPAPGIH